MECPLCKTTSTNFIRLYNIKGECSISLQELDIPIALVCGHVFSKDCIEEYNSNIYEIENKSYIEELEKELKKLEDIVYEKVYIIKELQNKLDDKNEEPIE